MNTFSFRGVNLRALTIDGNPWFVAADVCRCLGLYLAKGTGKHLAKLRPDEKRWVTPKQVRGLRGTGGAAVTESGLYKLILRSDKPEAREFQDWVTREVLPSIRRTGWGRHKR